jgi:hypothetical protein
VVDGRCDDRPAFDQRLPCTAQSGKLRSLKMQFDEGGRDPQRIEPTCGDSLCDGERTCPRSLPTSANASSRMRPAHE